MASPFLSVCTLFIWILVNAGLAFLSSSGVDYLLSESLGNTQQWIGVTDSLSSSLLSFRRLQDGFLHGGF
jgi:hypothetical protein